MEIPNMCTAVIKSGDIFWKIKMRRDFLKKKKHTHKDVEHSQQLSRAVPYI
jgi:hypothetical protein